MTVPRVVLLVLACGLLAACGSPDDASPPQRPAQQEETLPAVEPLLRAEQHVSEPDVESTAARDRATQLWRQVNEPAEISINQGEVSFTGPLNLANVESFMHTVAQADRPIERLVINSAGGYTVAGRRLGGWVFEHDVEVVVDELCGSSCANYVFTAAPRRTIGADALVYWHGSEQQDRYLAESQGLALDEYYAGQRQQAEKTQSIAEARQLGGSTVSTVVIIRSSTPSPTVNDEIEFLELIGVPVDALVYGMMHAQYDEWSTSDAYGWTFSLDKMAELGITDVLYQGEGTYPSAEALRRVSVIVWE